MSDSIEDRLRASIRDVPDFPREGVLFKDITTLLKDVKSFRLAVDEMSRSWNAPQLGQPPDKILGIESRGFIFGAPMAYQIGAGLLVARKPESSPPRPFVRPTPWSMARTRSSCMSTQSGRGNGVDCRRPAGHWRHRGRSD